MTSISTPPARGELRIVPLGGLGEIGMNCLALEQEDGILIVDCGVTFPQDDLGVDVLHPRFDWLVERRDRVVGLFLTHGHEDHVGAVPHLLTHLDVPVWGPAHALAIARHRLAERGGSGREELFETAPRREYRVGPFVVEPIRVTHSIAEATALAIRTAAGLVVHTGDFKLDPAPPDGELTDEPRFVELGDEGVRLLFSDSTNIDARGAPGSESTVGDELLRIVRRAEGRVVIGTFASNIQRLRRIGEVAIETRRKIALLGRSVQMQVRWAHELGHLAWPSDLVIPLDTARDLPRRKLLAIAGGTQAEPGSSLTRLGLGTYPQLALEPGDSVIFSSRIIPGNDPGVFDVMASFLRLGVELHNWITDPEVHVSGHAYRSEQARMLDMVRPQAFVPVHGTLHHLTRHAALAREKGVREVLVLENGQIAALDDAGLRRDGSAVVGKVATWAGRAIPDAVLRERESLGRAGVVHVTLVVDERGKLREPPAVQARGVFPTDGQAPQLRQIAKEIARAFEERPRREHRATDESLEDLARTAARRAVDAMTGRKPLSIATIVRV